METQDKQQVLATLSKIADGVREEIRQLPDELQEEAVILFGSHLTDQRVAKNSISPAAGYDKALYSFREDLLPVVEAVATLEKRFKEAQDAFVGKTEDEQIEMIKKQLQVVALEPLMEKLEDISTSMDQYYDQVGFSKYKGEMKKNEQKRNNSVGGFLFGDAEKSLKKESVKKEDINNGK